MKTLSRLLLGPTLAAVLLLVCTPTNAAIEAVGRPMTGLGVWQSTPAWELRFRSCRRTHRRWPRLFRGPKLPSGWRCRR